MKGGGFEEPVLVPAELIRLMTCWGVAEESGVFFDWSDPGPIQLQDRSSADLPRVAVWLRGQPPGVTRRQLGILQVL